MLCFATAVLTFFIAGLLFICASSTPITWERTASRPETGLLIPSGYISCGLHQLWVTSVVGYISCGQNKRRMATVGKKSDDQLALVGASSKGPKSGSATQVPLVFISLLLS